jgi:hypothetical protein
VAKAIVTLRSIHQSKIKPAPHLKEWVLENVEFP